MNQDVISENSRSLKWDVLERKSDFLLLVVPVVLLLLLTIPFINSAYWEDEIFSVISSRSWSGMFRIFREYENNMSLYLVFLHIWMHFFGEGEIATHSLSLLFAVLTIPVFYRLERIWLNKTTSLAGAVFLSINPLFVFYAVESRSYSMLVLSATVSTLIFIRLLNKPGFFLSLVYGVSIALGIYIHYFGILLLVVHGLAFSRKQLNWSTIKRFILSALVFILVVLPLFLFPPQNKSQIDWITRPDPRYLGYTIKDLFGGSVVILTLILSVLFTYFKGFQKNILNKEFFLSKLSVLWAILPACLVFVFSWLVKPAYQTRFFIWCLPGAAVLTCLILGWVPLNTFRKSLVCLFLFLIIIRSSTHVLKTKGSGYRDAAQYLYEQIQPGDIVVTYPYFKSIHTSYYLEKMKPFKPFAKPLVITSQPFLPGGGGIDPDPNLDTLRSASAINRKIYLVCKDTDSVTVTDNTQHRIWLPEIEKILSIKHAGKREKIFAPGSQDAVRVIVYE